MAKLYFKYGVMGASKTAEALMTRFRYEQTGQKAILVKPDIENRDGERTISSRIGLSAECILFSELKNLKLDDCSVIIVDECQFLSKEDVDFLAKLVDSKSIPVICYGLRSDFRTNLFEGSKRLFEIADDISEIKTVCHCGKKAIINARLNSDGKIVSDGDVIVMGSDNTYISLCRKHYKLMKLN